jgi:periplasmic divalent cation tolerance protein
MSCLSSVPTETQQLALLFNHCRDLISVVTKRHGVSGYINCEAPGSVRRPLVFESVSLPAKIWVFRASSTHPYLFYNCPMPALIVFSTFPDEISARKAAAYLVDARLAACVSIVAGVTSVYRWHGKVEHAGEVLLVVKTTQEAYARLESALKACHPYELPEILAVAPDAGLPEYLNWVEQEATCDHPERDE